ncbi:MAG: DUF2490 domain-containing protein [Cyanobacteria bacterium HKST-UBA03]|nr:DUF2490 domain-containing protein [Cyanobacteria bacterium HKST-UBA03]
MLLLLLLFGMAHPAKASDVDIDHDTGAMPVITFQKPLNETWTANTEFLLFTRQGFEPNIVQLRPSLTYKVTDHIALTGGYNYLDYTQTSNASEHWSWEQVEHTGWLKGVKISNRLRAEQRFIAGFGEPAHRLRYRLKGALPLDKAQRWWLISHNEVFVHANNLPNPSPLKGGFAQNRLFVGVGHQLTRRTYLETGYLAFYTNQPNPQHDNLRHNWHTWLVFKL